MKPAVLSIFIGILLSMHFCSGKSEPSVYIASSDSLPARTDTIKKKITKIKTVHVFVALCDNKYQGIVPVGKSIGNGQDAANNLYWGCAYGIKTYFKKKSSDWLLVENKKQVSSLVLERLLFKHRTRDVYLLADAYDGRYIRQTIIDFLDAAASNKKLLQVYKDDTLSFGGGSELVSYIGHDGLMDFELDLPMQTERNNKKTIILACYSKNFFAQHLYRTGASPLVWTTGLMAPEAYTLYDALGKWVDNKPDEEVRNAAAAAYAKYQKCSLKAARGLLVTGW